MNEEGKRVQMYFLICKNIECVDEVKDAVASALTQAKKDDLILITGSLFTVGEARGFLTDNKKSFLNPIETSI